MITKGRNLFVAIIAMMALTGACTAFAAPIDDAREAHDRAQVELQAADTNLIRAREQFVEDSLRIQADLRDQDRAQQSDDELQAFPNAAMLMRHYWNISYGENDIVVPVDVASMPKEIAADATGAYFKILRARATKAVDEAFEPFDNAVGEHRDAANAAGEALRALNTEEQRLRDSGSEIALTQAAPRDFRWSGPLLRWRTINTANARGVSHGFGLDYSDLGETPQPPESAEAGLPNSNNYDLIRPNNNNIAIRGGGDNRLRHPPNPLGAARDPLRHPPNPLGAARDPLRHPPNPLGAARDPLRHPPNPRGAARDPLRHPPNPRGAARDPLRHPPNPRGAADPPVNPAWQAIPADQNDRRAELNLLPVEVRHLDAFYAAYPAARNFEVGDAWGERGVWIARGFPVAWYVLLQNQRRLALAAPPVPRPAIDPNRIAENFRPILPVGGLLGVEPSEANLPLFWNELRWARDFPHVDDLLADQAAWRSAHLPDVWFMVSRWAAGSPVVARLNAQAGVVGNAIDPIDPMVAAAQGPKQRMLSWFSARSKYEGGRRGSARLSRLSLSHLPAGTRIKLSWVDQKGHKRSRVLTAHTPSVNLLKRIPVVKRVKRGSLIRVQLTRAGYHTRDHKFRATKHATKLY